MATFSRIKVWVSNEVLTASDLNTEFNNIINYMDPTGIDDSSSTVAAMQTTTDPGGVGTESLATTLQEELRRIRFALKRIAGGAQWYVAPLRNLTTTFVAADLASDAVETAKIKNGAVTTAKMATANLVKSTSTTGSFSTSSVVTLVDVTNATLSITTTGRPVMVSLVADTATEIYMHINAVSGYSNAVCYFLYNSSIDGDQKRELAGHYSSSAVTPVPNFAVGGDTITTQPGGGGVSSWTSSATYTALHYYSASSFMQILSLSAGTHTIKMQAAIAAGATALHIDNAKLMAWEL